MNEDEFLERPRAASGAKQTRTTGYTSKDFQLEVLRELEELRALAESLLDAQANELKKEGETSRLLRFDGRTLVAIGAIALSLTGYVLQDARNSSKRDADIETTKARVTNLEKVEAANTEGRIRAEVEMGELAAGQNEIKVMLQWREKGSKGAAARK
jgi:hypothetical protein